MPKDVALPSFSLVGFASIGALAGVLVAVLVGLVHPLDVPPSTPGEPRARLAGVSTVESIVPALAPVTMPAPSVLAPNVSRMASAEPEIAIRRTRRVDVCLDANRPACRRVFEQALGTGAAASPASTAADDDGREVAASTAAAASLDALPAGEPLHFSSKPEWVRRLDRLGREGLPFVRVPRGLDHELVIGINRKGVLGAFLVETSPSAVVMPSGDTAGQAGAEPR